MKRLVLLGFILAGAICMAQTTNYIPKFNSSTTFGNSIIYQNGSNIGIGTTSPYGKLHVVGNSNFDGSVSIYRPSENWYWALDINVYNDYTKAIVVFNHSIAPNTEVFRVNGNGVVGAKKIYAEAFEVLSGAVGIYWFDHVFDKDYNLRTLSEVEEYINENHHLPEIPSQQEVNENGYNLGDMQGKLLMKIEELTLYIIELEKRISELEGNERGE